MPIQPQSSTPTPESHEDDWEATFFEAAVDLAIGAERRVTLTRLQALKFAHAVYTMYGVVDPGWRQ
jgi:hypothetical protein